ncbi:MAG: ABC transporter ATP-binding protein [Caldicoprobacterales bacterium]|jgi:oligopeptide/dipeptide ABC transporter ATP-binding protein
MSDIKSENIILKIRDLKVYFDGYKGATQVLNNISLDIRKGEALGIVGESGCGKSITALSIMRLLQSPPARIEGSINFCGTELLTLSPREMQSIRGNRISMIFQDPMTSLNPVFTIGHQLSEVFMLHQNMTRENARKASIEALHMVNVAAPEKRINNYPYQLSGGMRQRVMIAMALACRPELLIADEPTTALDVTIQAQVLDLMNNLRDSTGAAIAFITHDLGVVSEMCERAVVLYCGEIVEEAMVEELFSQPKHPYTKGLLAALPKRGSRGRKLYVIPGTVPPAGQFPKGCVFAPRCIHALDRCHLEKPPVTIFNADHKAKCFLYEEK